MQPPENDIPEEEKMSDVLARQEEHHEEGEEQDIRQHSYQIIYDQMDNDSSQNNLTEEKPVNTGLDFNPYQTNLQCETPGVTKDPPLTSGSKEDKKDQDSSETFSKITTLNQPPSEEAAINAWETTDNER